MIFDDIEGDERNFQAPGFERFVTASEAASLIYSGKYDHLSALQFREKFPWFGEDDEDE